MEAGFGHSFADVRVHAEARAAADVGAIAFTVGSRIVFAAGSYAPDTPRGQRLIAHELAHVVQQRPARPVDFARLRIDRSACGVHEREADHAADAVMDLIHGGGGTAPSLQIQGGPLVQRQSDAPKDVGGIKNVTLKGFGTKPTPRASRHKTLTDFIHVILDQPFAGTGEATVEDEAACKQLRFGFIQLCRPFSVHRAIYEAKGGGERYEINNIDTLRAPGPLLDLHAKGDRWYSSDTPDCAKGGKAKVGFDDKPATVFPIQPPFLATPVFIRGLAWQEFFFTTFSVAESGKDVRHLRSLYWTILYCETFDPPKSGQALGKSLAKTAKLKVKMPDRVPSEPGLKLMGEPAKKTCNEEHRSFVSLRHKGPGKHDSPCPIAGEKD